MRKFLIRTLIFFSLGFCIVLGYHYSIYRFLLLDTQHYLVDDGVTTIVIGDSHTETSIDDSQFAGLQNHSYRGESFFIMYYKLKQLLRVNAEIDEVILSFSYHSLNEFQDAELQNVLYEYYWLLDKKGLTQVTFSLKNLDIVVKDMNGRLFEWLKAPVRNTKFNLLTGGYRGLEVRNLSEDSTHERILSHYYADDETRLQRYSTVQENYLAKIIQLCLDKNISLEFINTPLHQSYLDNIPQHYIDDYYIRIDALKKSHPGKIGLLDFKDAVKKDELFHDGDHLTIEGGKQFMPILKDALSSL